MRKGLVVLLISLVLCIPLQAREREAGVHLTSPSAQADGGQAQFAKAQQQENFWDAIKAYRQITSQYPQTLWACEAQFRIGQYYYLHGNYEQAHKDYEKLLSVCPQSPRVCEAQYWIGASLLAEGGYVEARSAFEDVLASYPENNFSAWAQVGLADAYFKEGNYKRAAQEYERVLANYPQSDVRSLVYLPLGQSYEHEGEPGKAVRVYQRLIEGYPWSLDVREARRRINSAASDKYSVQVGAFRDPARANGLAQRLRSRGYAVYLLTTEVRGELFHRVRVGTFENTQEAQAIIDRLKEQEHLSGRIYIEER
jgi:TolA-binding protein